MSEVRLDGETLTVHFTRGEKVLGVMGDLEVPRSAITSAALVQSWSEVRGLKVGLGIPGRRLLGTWHRRGHHQLVDLRRGEPAVRLGLRGSAYDEVLVRTPDAERLVAELAYLG